MRGLLLLLLLAVFACYLLVRAFMKILLESIYALTLRRHEAGY